MKLFKNYNWSKFLINLRNPWKRFIFISVDSFNYLISSGFVFWILYSSKISFDLIWLFISGIILTPFIYSSTRQYSVLSRYIGSYGFYKLLIGSSLVVLAQILIAFFCGFRLLPLKGFFLIWLFLFFFTSLFRLLIKDILVLRRTRPKKELISVAIYGAGSAGVQLASTLRADGKHSIVAFFDDNPLLWGRNISGIPIISPKRIFSFQMEMDQLLLAIPSLNRTRRRLIIDSLKKQNIPLLEIPSIDDITSGRAKIDTLRPISIGDLLGRDKFISFDNSNTHSLQNAVVLITGAGGSIGSELSRQILKLKPSKLVLLDLSEHSLYQIDMELGSINNVNTEIISILGNTSDFSLMDKVVKQYKVNIIYHAAAYKHVPLVELNPLQGLKNNILSTLSIAKVANDNSLKQAILISTDKAVRPTNIMGASKRVSEIIFQAYSSRGENLNNKSNKSSPIFSIVRFGNVLGSSGSVVPLFRQQIENGGPITVTHPDVTRYLMSIQEAVKLVLQASEISKGGDILLLDMGEPVKIKELAEQMVRQSGLNIRNKENPNGDIEIKFIGMRPGEKLYEELLIDGRSFQTSHPLIYLAGDQIKIDKNLWDQLDTLRDYLEKNFLEDSIRILNKLVPEWKRFYSNQK